jgi:hypothetical protein
MLFASKIASLVSIRRGENIFKCFIVSSLALEGRAAMEAHVPTKAAAQWSWTLMAAEPWNRLLGSCARLAFSIAQTFINCLFLLRLLQPHANIFCFVFAFLKWKTQVRITIERWKSAVFAFDDFRRHLFVVFSEPSQTFPPPYGWIRRRDSSRI